MLARRLLRSILLALPLLAASAVPAAAQTFGYTGSQQTYTVPAGITQLNVSMSGADGGEGAGLGDFTNLSPGGHGGTVSAVLTVSAGGTLFVEVGGAGGTGGATADQVSDAPPPTAGWNGGALPGEDQSSACCGFPYGGSGGGATDIRTLSSAAASSLSSRLLVAGGGGGGGYDPNSQTASAGSNASAGAGPSAVTGIQGGSAGASGPGAGGAACAVDVGTDTNGSAGVSGTGGSGGTSTWDLDSNVLVASAGGGGGGYYGGGGGAGCTDADSGDQSGGGGGGGSDFASAAASSVSTGIDSTAGANGSVTINPAAPGLLTAPSIKGTFASGNTLSVTAGTYTNSPTKLAYQWLRCNAGGAGCTAISGATGAVWPLTSADVGRTLKVQETATSPYGTAAAVLSAATPEITGPPAPTTNAPVTGGTPPAVVPTHVKLGSVRVAGAQATVLLTCAGAAGTCRGAIAAKAATAKHHATTKAKRTTTQPTVGRASFKLASGRAIDLKLKLNKAGRKMLDETYRLPADLTVSGTTTLHRQISFAYPRVRAHVSWTWSFTGNHTHVQQLNVTGIPPHGLVTVLCSGGGCVTDHARLTPKHGHEVALIPAVSNNTLTAGAKLQVTISAPNQVAKVVDITVRSDHYPDVAFACQPPGVSHPTACA